MQRFVRVFGTVLGLLWSAYGVAVVTGMAAWPLLQRYLNLTLAPGVMQLR